MSALGTPMKPVHASQRAAAQRCAARYTIEGDLRYLSHRDELRMLARAMARAAWPLRHSAGFNPIPRIALPLPRSVGMESLCQVALVDLSEAVEAQTLRARLAGQMPAKARLLAVASPVGRRTPHAVRVHYEIDLTPEDAAIAAERVAALLASPSRTVERVTRRRPAGQEIDVRSFVDSITLENRMVRMALRLDGQRTAKPTEIITELGLSADAYRCRVRRAQVDWDIAPDALDEAPATQEGTDFGNEEDSP